MIVLGDMDTRAGDVDVEGVISKFAVWGKNWPGVRMGMICATVGLIEWITSFRKKEFDKYT